MSLLSKDILQLINPKEATLSQLLEVAVASGQYPSGDNLLEHKVQLPSQEELSLAKAGKLPLGRATELGMYNTPGNPASTEEWEKALKRNEEGLVVAAYFGLGRTDELGLSKTKFVP